MRLLIWFQSRIFALNQRRVAPRLWSWLLRIVAKLSVLLFLVAFAEAWRVASFWHACWLLLGLWIVHDLLWPAKAAEAKGEADAPTEGV